MNPPLGYKKAFYRVYDSGDTGRKKIGLYENPKSLFL